MLPGTLLLTNDNSHAALSSDRHAVDMGYSPAGSGICSNKSGDSRRVCLVERAQAGIPMKPYDYFRCSINRRSDQAGSCNVDHTSQERFPATQ